MKVLMLAAVALVAGAAAAGAQDALPVCTSNGITYKVGDEACIPACHGAERYARCDLVGSSASWTTISDICPMASLPRAAPDAILAMSPSVMTPLPAALSTPFDHAVLLAGI